MPVPVPEAAAEGPKAAEGEKPAKGSPAKKAEKTPEPKMRRRIGVRHLGYAAGGAFFLWPVVGGWVPTVLTTAPAVWVVAALIAGQQGDQDPGAEGDDDQEQPQEEAGGADRGTALLLHVVGALAEAEAAGRVGLHLDVVLASAVAAGLLAEGTEQGSSGPGWSALACPPPTRSATGSTARPRPGWGCGSTRRRRPWGCPRRPCSRPAPRPPSRPGGDPRGGPRPGARSGGRGEARRGPRQHPRRGPRTGPPRHPRTGRSAADFRGVAGPRFHPFPGPLPGAGPGSPLDGPIGPVTCGSIGRLTGPNRGPDALP